MLLIDLLKSGQRPNLVVFMDGVNWPYAEEESEFTDTIERRFRNIQFGSDTSVWDELRWVPVIRLASAINRRLALSDTKDHDGHGSELAGDDLPYDLIINRFEQNSRIATQVGAIYSATPLFFTQPNAIHNYNFELYRPKLPDSFQARRVQTKKFYNLMRGRKDAIYLGDLFESWGHERKAIVDDVHYSPGFNEFLASHVAANIPLQALTVRDRVIDRSSATGLPRDAATSPVNPSSPARMAK
jgi:hypothetical protein